MKQKMVDVTCQECNKTWKETKTWHGQSEVCSSCADKRRDRDNCKRHGGKLGQDCHMCKLEGMF